MADPGERGVTQIEGVPAAPQAAVRCEPVPTWVECAPYAVPADPSASRFIDNGLCRLLSESQVNLCPLERQWHFRRVQKVLTRAGAERVSHFGVEFDPAYERVAIHHVRIFRDGQIIEHAHADAFQTFRREANLEMLILNGRLTASLLIPDVRVGDIVETALTVTGSNPALKGKFAGWVVFDDVEPFYQCRHRQLRPVDRPVASRAFNDPPGEAITVADGVVDARWCLEDGARHEVEEYAVPWHLHAPTLQFSEFPAWSDVSCLFAPYYETAEIPEGLAREIDQLATRYPDPADRAVEWLRFVQRELRYFALSFGEGGLMPRGLAAIWSSRFGDCKDAAQLYVAGARRLELEACAALTSTTYGIALPDFLAASDLFNHCIVRLRLNGTSYWLDPTCPEQTGRLAKLSQVHFGWALPLSGDADALEQIGPGEPAPQVNVEDEVEVGPKPDSPARLTRQVEYYSRAADDARHRFANGGSADYANDRLKEVQAFWPRARQTGAIEVQDDRSDNCLTVILRYDVPDCWRADGKRLAFQICDLVVASELGTLKSAEREGAIILGRPRQVAHRTTLKMPRRWTGDGWHRGEEGEGLSFLNRLRIEGRTLVNERAITVSSWTMPAAGAADYMRVVEAMHTNILNIWARKRFGRIAPIAAGRFGFKFDFGKAWLIWVGIMVVAAILKAYSQK